MWGRKSNSHAVNTILDGGYRWVDSESDSPTRLYVRITDYSGGVDAVRSWEARAFWAAMETWERVADVDFRYSRVLAAADVIPFTATKRSFPTEVPAEVVAAQDGPFYASRNPEKKALGVYFRDNPDWTVAGTSPGGAAFEMLVHEFGHALGLAHPFDRGPSGQSEFGGRFVSPLVSVMTYASWTFDSDGFVLRERNLERDNSAEYNYGNVIGPSALDIAAVQFLYGANLDQDDGDGDGSPDDVYWLPSKNKAGVGWKTIWDTDGVDWIRYGGDRVAQISLVPANASGEAAPSQARWIKGGLIIAGDFTKALAARQDGFAGVLIENASGGGGADTITGNAAGNALLGNDGDDKIAGGFGADLLYGGDGEDQLEGGNDDDRIAGNKGDDALAGGWGRDRFVFRAGDGEDVIGDFSLRGGDVIDLRGHAQAGSFEEIMAAARESAFGFTRLFIGEDRISLRNVELEDLQSNDFLL